MIAIKIYLAVGAVATGAYFLLPAFAQNVEFVVFGAAAVTAIISGVRRYGPDKLLSWYLIPGGISLVEMGDVIWSYYEEIRNVESQFPSVADGLYFDSARFTMDSNNV
ncbi:hypothetical protein BH23ACT11_BH23ACT11_13700 [soil metagenome]